MQTRNPPWIAKCRCRNRSAPIPCRTFLASLILASNFIRIDAPPIELGRSSLVSASSRLIDVKRPSVTLWNGDPGLKDDPLGFRMWRQVIWAVIPAGSCTISSFFFDTRPNETICVVNRPIIRRDFGFNYEHWPICRNCATDKPVENQVSTTIQVQ